MYKLIIEDDEGKTWVVPLIRDEVSIGRKDGNTIRLTERNVSRKHARLIKSNGSIYIEDLHSYNGIKVNGERIAERAPVAEGDRIQIGDYQLALKLDRSATVDESRGEEKTTPYSKDESRGAPGGEPPRAAPAAAPSNAAAVVTAPPSAPTAAMPPISGAAPQAPAEERPARLVVVSSNFAGKEFRLNKPESVVGRTADNDVVIDHRSISRHHAKVLRDAGRYQIQDLGSSNGVRVNGEEYGKVELRKGDLIDLGHVRLRFVAPNEDFVFARDAKVVDVDEKSAGGGKGKGMIMGVVAAAVLLVGGIVAVVAFRGPSDGSKATTEPGASPQVAAAEANATVDRALKALDWNTAIAEADKGLKANPADDILRDKKTKAEAEAKVAPIFEEYQRAVKADDAETAVAKYSQLPEHSIYHDKAQDSWAPVRRNYVTAHLARARSLQTAGQCDVAKQQVEKVLLVDETNAEAQDIARKCGQQAVAPPSPHHVPVPPAPAPHNPPPAPPRPREHVEAPPTPAPRPEAPKPPAGGGGGGSVDDLVGRAQDDYVRGAYAESIDMARRALRGDANNSKAWRIIGASSCFLKDKAGASSAWNKLGNMDRQFLKYVCGRNAITIP